MSIENLPDKTLYSYSPDTSFVSSGNESAGGFFNLGIFNNFFNFQSSDCWYPQMFNFDLQNINMFQDMFNFDFSNINFSFMSDKSVASNCSSNDIYSKYSSDKYFNKMLDYILTWEGGLANLQGDSGGLTKNGVTTDTYNEYRDKKNLPRQSVAQMTENEKIEIYHKIYVDCGADKIRNPKLALYVFDTAVNMGSKRAKEILSLSNGNLAKFETIRRQKYQSIAKNNPKKQKFLKGWNNRVDGIKNFAANNLPSNLDTIA